MRTYRSHKTIEAAQIVAIMEQRAGRVYALEGGRRYACPANFEARYVAQVGDYLVRYSDGYHSVSPKATFEEGYALLKSSPVDQMLQGLSD